MAKNDYSNDYSNRYSNPEVLQLNKHIIRCRPDKVCIFCVKFFVLFYSII